MTAHLFTKERDKLQLLLNISSEMLKVKAVDSLTLGAFPCSSLLSPTFTIFDTTARKPREHLIYTGKSPQMQS